jgi:hypothetical protein
MSPETFIQRVRLGCDWGWDQPRLSHLVGSYYVLSAPGGTTSGIGRRSYVTASHDVVDLSGPPKGSGYALVLNCQVRAIPTQDGRLTKAVREQWLKTLSS